MTGDDANAIAARASRILSQFESVPKSDHGAEILIAEVDDLRRSIVEFRIVNKDRIRRSTDRRAETLANTLVVTYRSVGPFRQYENPRRDLRLLRRAIRSFAKSVTSELAAGAEAAPASRLSRTAIRILTVVVQLLPAADQARYSEQFTAEMFDLAKHEQLRYALSMLRGVGNLRLVLLENAADAVARKLID
jgi:hypothetical protein